MAKNTDDALAEMDAGLLHFRAKMKAKKVESEASLLAQDAEFASMAASPPSAAPDTTLVATEELPTVKTAQSAEPEAVPTGSRFKMSLYSRVRSQKN